MTDMIHRATTLAEPHNNDIEDYAAVLDRRTRLGQLKISLNRIHHTIHSGYDAQPLGSVVTVPQFRRAVLRRGPGHRPVDPGHQPGVAGRAAPRLAGRLVLGAGLGAFHPAHRRCLHRPHHL
ncbi:MAG: hypothetical protein WDN06_09710 [Asticcacaulis sp.]